MEVAAPFWTVLLASRYPMIKDIVDFITVCLNYFSILPIANMCLPRKRAHTLASTKIFGLWCTSFAQLLIHHSVTTMRRTGYVITILF
jgi:hypothetical protein